MNKEVRGLAIHLYGRKVLQAGGRANAKTQNGSVPGTF